MADSSLLAALLAGNDPQSAQLLSGYQGSQLSNAAIDPNFGHNEGLAGALAKTLAGFRGGNMMSDAVAQNVAAREAARPEMLSAVTNPGGPLAYAQQNPGISQVGLAQILAMKPEDVQGYIEAGRLGRANAPGATPLVGGPAAQPGLPGWGKLNSPQGASAARPLTMTSGPAISGRLPVAAPSADAPAVDPVAAAAAMTPQQRQAMAQNPQMRAQLVARLRALAMQRAQAAAQPSGAGGAVQPGP